MGAIGQRVKQSLTDARTMAKALPGLIGSFAQNPYAGLMSGLKTLESKSIATAHKIADALKRAWSSPSSGSLGGGVSAKEEARARMRGQKQPSGMSTGGFATLMGAKAILEGVAHKGMELTDKANSVEEAATQLSVNAKKGGGAYVDPQALQAEAYGVAQDVKGTDAGAALEAMSKFVTLTGDLDTARKSITTFAIASKASGADLGAVAESAASISKQFGIVDPNQIKDVLAAMIYQGKEGAVMLPDMAKGLQRLAAAGSAFGLSKDVGGVRKLGGFAQLARGGAGSAEQAFTAVESTFKALLEKSADFKKNKVNVYEGKGSKKHTRAIDDVLVDAISKVGGKDLAKKNEKLGELFGGEAMRAINPLTGIYNTAFQGAQGKGGKEATDAERQAAGVAALRKAFADMNNAAGTWTDVVEDSAQMEATNTAKTTASMQLLQQRVAEQVLPRFGTLVDKLTDSDAAIDLFVTGLELMADMANDFASLLKELGLIKAPKTTRLEHRDQEQKTADEARAKLKAMQMSPEAIAKLEKSDPNKLAAMRAEASKLQQDAFVHQGLADFWEKKDRDDPRDDADGPVVRGTRMSLKAREQREAAKAALGAAGAAPGAPAGAGAPGAPGGPHAQAPAKAGPQGPVNVQGVVQVRVVADDTSKRAGGAAPMPARYPRG